jgi:hypothetical protein
MSAMDKLKQSMAEPETGPSVTGQTPEQTRVASELRRLHLKRKEIEEQIDMLKTELLDSGVTEGYRVFDENGNEVCKARRVGRRFDPMAAATKLPQAVIDQISTMQIDPKVAKVKLPPAVYQECMTDGSVSLVLSR